MVNRLNNWFARQQRVGQWPWMLCGWLVLASWVQAGAPEPYGENFVRLGESWPDAGPVLSLLESTPVAAQDGASYRQQVSELEREGGPYANTLAEPLAGLGRLHRQNGDIAEAQRHYQRALHVVRVNDGLYSERQLPILRALFESYRLSGDLQALDERYDYFFRLYGSGRPPHTPVRLGATTEYLRWQREALRLNASEDDKARLLAAYQLNEQVLERVSGDESVDLPAYRKLVMSQVRNLYLLEHRYAPRKESLAVTSNPIFATVWDDTDFAQKQLEVIRRNGLARGRTLLEQLIARTPSEATVELARAYLELADWNQWNGRTEEAQDSYKRVVSLLRQGNREDLLSQWLAGSVELPANGAFWQPRPEPDSEQAVVVTTHYDISEEGRVANIQMAEAQAEAGADQARTERNERQAYKLRRRLKQTRFRPRFINGHAEAEQQLVRSYQLID